MVDFASASGDYGYGSKPQLFHTPMFHVKEKPLPIGVEGLIQCKSGPKTTPIQGMIPNYEFLHILSQQYV